MSVWGPNPDRLNTGLGQLGAFLQQQRAQAGGQPPAAAADEILHAAAPAAQQGAEVAAYAPDPLYAPGNGVASQVDTAFGSQIDAPVDVRLRGPQRVQVIDVPYFPNVYAVDRNGQPIASGQQVATQAAGGPPQISYAVAPDGAAPQVGHAATQAAEAAPPAAPPQKLGDRLLARWLGTGAPAEAAPAPAQVAVEAAPQGPPQKAGDRLLARLFGNGAPAEAAAPTAAAAEAVPQGPPQKIGDRWLARLTGQGAAAAPVETVQVVAAPPQLAGDRLLDAVFHRGAAAHAPEAQAAQALEAAAEALPGGPAPKLGDRLFARWGLGAPQLAAPHVSPNVVGTLKTLGNAGADDAALAAVRGGGAQVAGGFGDALAALNALRKVSPKG